jgi:hypothetical protein
MHHNTLGERRSCWWRKVLCAAASIERTADKTNRNMQTEKQKKRVDKQDAIHGGW